MTRKVAVTFDNLGEASKIEQGAWPADRPRGRHPSVVRALPRALALLDDVGVLATFFVEGINAELYPNALGSILDRGHELACHAWCHEDWGALEPAVLTRATQVLRALGPVEGFRPRARGGTPSPGWRSSSRCAIRMSAGGVFDLPRNYS